MRYAEIALLCAAVVLLHSTSHGGSSALHRVCDETQELIELADALCGDRGLTRNARITQFAWAMAVLTNKVQPDIAVDRAAREVWRSLPTVLGVWLKEGCTRGDFEDHIIKGDLGRRCRHLKYPR